MNLIAKAVCAVTLLVAAVACTALVGSAVNQNQSPMTEPRVIDPGPVGGRPSDAIVLFDGKDLSQWSSKNGGPAKWEVKDGVAIVTRTTGDIVSKQEFGDVQLHVEWATPAEVKGEGQGRGNSGVFLQSRYEVQVLDSYQNKTYFHGQAGGVYKQYPPLVNACRKPGEWQAYDIIFHAPAFDDSGNVTRRATMTVLHNGVLIQDNVQVQGTTTHEGDPKYTKHPPKAPIQLQDHGDPVRYRNIWVRPL